MSWLTLRFQDRGQEIGYLKHCSTRLRKHMFYCAGFVAFYLTGLVGYMASDWLRGGNERLWENGVYKGMFWGVVVVWALALATTVAARTTWLLRRVSFQALEAACAVLIIIYMLSIVLTNWTYLGKLAGLDPYAIKGVSPCQDTDSFVLMMLSVSLVAGNLVLPIRWVVVWVVGVIAVLLYAICIYILGSNDNMSGRNLGLLVMLGVLTSFGKRQHEQLERGMLSSLVTEKSLRAQAEYQLSQNQTAASPDGEANGEQPQPVDVEDTRSVCSTTLSAKIFEGLDDITSKHQLNTVGMLGRKEQWLLNTTKDLQAYPDKVLGVGGFGIVVAGSFLGTPVAIKMARTSVHVRSLSDIANELRIFRKLRHPNIVLFHGACIDFERWDVALVLELINGRSMEVYIIGDGEDEEPPNDLKRLQCMEGICHALAYLHTRTPHIVHGDLKPQNIRVEERGVGPHAKILDFGLARLVTNRAKPLGGTYRWVAPEVFSMPEQPPKPSADIFSFGRVLFFAATGDAPYEDLDNAALRVVAKKGVVPALEWRTPATPFVEWCRPLVDECTETDPTARPSMIDMSNRLAEQHLHDEPGGFANESVPVRKDSKTPQFWHTVKKIRREVARQLAPKGTSSLRKVAKKAAKAAGQAGETAANGEAAANTKTEDSVRLLRPGFNETELKTMVLSCLGSLMLWNFRLKKGACCPYHNAVATLGLVYQECQKLNCVEDWGDGDAEDFAQCPKCGLMGQCAQDEFECDICDT